MRVFRYSIIVIISRAYICYSDFAKHGLAKHSVVFGQVIYHAADIISGDDVHN